MGVPRRRLSVARVTLAVYGYSTSRPMLDLGSIWQRDTEIMILSYHDLHI